MPPLQETTRVFIIRIWREARSTPEANPEWRGVIENVAKGKRAYFRDLEEIIDFIRPELEEMGVREENTARPRKFWRRILDFLDSFRAE